jgi:TubC N-terminal docking domain
MSALAKIRAAGFSVSVEGEKLKVKPAGQLTEMHRESIKIHRDEIITGLREDLKAALKRRYGDRLEWTKP